MNHVILTDGRLLSAADFAAAYLDDPTLTCAVIVAPFSPRRAGRGDTPAGSTAASPHARADDPCGAPAPVGDLPGTTDNPRSE